MKIQLRGGLGNNVVGMRHEKIKVSVAARSIEDIRAQREAMLEIEAENEGLAIYGHRLMAPARQRRYEN
jgi:hypothetical protein